MNITKKTSEEIYKKVSRATKWSAITQISTKIIAPITNMILARILAPESFGIVATVIMVTSFADIFTDAGFQQYLIQHKFENQNERNNSVNVAFWTNLFISVSLWIIVVIFRNKIARMVGNPGLGDVVAIACIQLPITSFSSIQTALYRRDLNFKPLFIAQLLGACMPIIITLPLAILGLGFWSIIIGNICGAIIRAMILTIKSEWHPRFYYNIQVLRNMLSYSLWALMEAISVWLISWADTFIISNAFSSYYLGLYKNSLSMVNSLMAIITATITPILFSTLSRLQEDEIRFNIFFLKTQKLIAYFVLPIGVGVFLYRELATYIMLGPQWSEAQNIIGVWALTSSIRIVFVSIYSEVYRAKGRPKLCLVLQIIDLMILVPSCIISIKGGFWNLVYTRALVRFNLIIPGFYIMSTIVHIPIKTIIKNVTKPFCFTLVIYLVVLFLQKISGSVIWSFISIAICALCYFILMLLFARDDIDVLIRIIKPKIRK